jgi:hypothetical protein
VNAAQLQERLYSGNAKVAQKLGRNHGLYRPSSAMNPIAAGNLVATLPAWLTSGGAPPASADRPNRFGEATRIAIVDGTQTLVGDYLVAGDGTSFFIAAMEPLLPILAVACNRIVSLARPQAGVMPGAQPYGGDLGPAAETPLMSGWPASVLAGSGGGPSEAKLPGDVGIPGWNLLLPAWPGAALRPGDIVSDDTARRFIVASAELSPLGWRIRLRQAIT